MAMTHTDGPVRILLVDDDRDDFILTKDLLEEIPNNRYQLDWVATFQEGLDAICRNEHDVYILDYQLGEKTGLDLLKEARCRGCLGPVILFTGQTNGEVDQRAMEAGAADFLEKGRIDATLLERSIRYSLQKKRYEAELERKVQERTRELAEANEALRVADLKKDEFLATLAHELRNPLAPIRNAIEIIRLGGDKPDTIERARAIMERQVGQLVRLVDDLLDVSRVTRGKLRLNIEKLDVASIMDAAVEISRPHLDQARVSLTVTPPSTPVIVNGDRIRLAQVLSNLLNNAAKFTDAGGKVDLIGERDGDRVAIHVRDTGVGIAADLLPQVFDLFTQMDRTVNRSQGGLGIGLALVRRLVEIHGGNVHAKSDGPGKGAEFTVFLPAPLS
jgi:signal transduction histidine kinase